MVLTKNKVLIMQFLSFNSFLNLQELSLFQFIFEKVQKTEILASYQQVLIRISWEQLMI
jgi:hypothetical protein